ncbi:hypothetical protein M378DRAFT_110564 [Amanita muscaria Koide BX008]|uniref:CDC20/Fizzy WD40 domain-containing protein n=1 Tax=Amanita muscaria (strain Koide BX008) TaxID=946122 RepID=A0A0C2WUF8_AMAMK|nr:hypothetical protein M378DRAFT_110564 [Amanita muscaria Koide BX008]
MATRTGEDCVAATPDNRARNLKRSSSHAFLANLYSTKKRRTSYASVDLGKGLPEEPHSAKAVTREIADRFIPKKPKTTLPLNVTPRTNRIGRHFGILGEKVLSYKDENTNPVNENKDSNTFNLLRKSVSSLFVKPTEARPTSVVENLKKKRQCSLTLDGPGIANDTYGYPISWSNRNLIAVACGNDVFYQNLNTKVVARMCSGQEHLFGRIQAIEWAEEAHDTYLALGTTVGSVQIWEADASDKAGTIVRSWEEESRMKVTSLSWKRHVVAVGSLGGSISLFDLRDAAKAAVVPGHKGQLLSLKWSTDDNYLASGDDLGVVRIWDKRACKTLLEPGAQSAKMRHRGPVKALAWCSWKPDLLATGSLYPEGKIRIWSASTLCSSPLPLETITLNTSVFSLHWSLHCKELLSTHGPSFTPSATLRRTLSNANFTPFPSIRDMKPVPSVLTNAIAVHDYPSCMRLLSLPAHTHPVTHSCLGPNGRDLFTVCPMEETIKMWQVWGERPEVDKRDSVFDRCTIR